MNISIIIRKVIYLADGEKPKYKIIGVGYTLIKYYLYY